MIQEFAGLTAEESQALVDAVPLITILIAGADGNIDAKEREWATKLTEIRGYAHPDSLQEYYQAVGDQYGEKLNHLIDSLPKDVNERTKLISEKLSSLNASLAKLDINYAYNLYKSLTSFAEHVAKASGGFLRFATVSKEEAKLINLPMINPIEIEEEEGEA